MSSRELADVAVFFDEQKRDAVARGDQRHAEAYQEVAGQAREHASAARAREVRLRDIAMGVATRRFFVLR